MNDGGGSGSAGKIAIITGVGNPGGIGRALAGAFLRGGYSVGGLDLVDKLEETEGTPVKTQAGNFVYSKADVSKPDEVISDLPFSILAVAVYSEKIILYTMADVGESKEAIL